MQKVRFFVNSEEPETEKGMARSVLSYLHQMGYEGNSGREMQTINDDEEIEMTFIEIEVSDDYEEADFHLLAEMVHKELETYTSP